MLIDRLTKTTCQQFQVQRLAKDISDSSQWVGLSETIDPDFLTLAYQHGVFPWPMGEEYKIPWVSPLARGVIFRQEFHITQSLKKIIKRTQPTIYFNRNFQQVINYCQNTPTRQGQQTWINQEIMLAYKKLFERKLAYCIEVEDSAGVLMGGLYGVCINGIISGESMFYLSNGGSKIALTSLMYQLKQMQIPLLDTQMTTPVVAQFGGREIEREEYLVWVENLVKIQIKREELFPPSIDYHSLLN
jgi:leucyl/phenylalanyl-tRNA---protein transferase